MFHQLNQQCRKGRYIAPLLLLVFALCWGQNLGWLEGCPKHQGAPAAEQIVGSHADSGTKHENAKADCDKTAHLLQQFQSQFLRLIAPAKKDQYLNQAVMNSTLKTSKISLHHENRQYRCFCTAGFRLVLIVSGES